MLAASSTPNDPTVLVTVITTIGIIAVAVIGTYTARITSGARKEALDSANSASRSADLAKDYAAALGAKDALIESLHTRLEYIEEVEKRCGERLEELEKREEEHEEQRRASHIIERDQSRRIDELQAQLDSLKGG